MTGLMINNLPLLSGAPNGIKKLRELILELAVRGKLVPQDPNDEPASELLKRIAEENARLVAEGKVKKQKPLAEISEEDNPFELPRQWEWIRLGEIAEIIRGVTYNKSDASDAALPEYAPLLRGNNINRTLNFDRPVFVPKKLISEQQYIRVGDIVIAMSSGSADLVGKAAQATASFDGAFGAFCGVVRSRTSGLFELFGFFFQTPLYRSRAAGHGKGIGINNLQKSALETLEIPIPPLAEQHRIVAKVDELMTLCDRLEAQQAYAESAHAQLVQALLDSLTQASDATDFAANWQRLAEHFHTLFTTESSIDALKQTLLQLAVMGKLVPQDPNDEPASLLLKRIAEEKAQMVAEGKLKKQKSLLEISDEEKLFQLPAGWEWVRFGSLLDFQGGGQPPKSQFSDEPKSGYVQLIQIRDLGERPQPVFIKRELASKFCTPNDIMVGRYGASVGKVFWGKEGAYNVALVKIVDQHHKFSREFLFQLLRSPVGQAYFSGISRSAQDGFNKSDIEQKLVPFCSISEQHRIVAKVDQLMALCDQLKSRLTQARQLNEQLASTLVEQVTA